MIGTLSSGSGGDMRHSSAYASVRELLRHLLELLLLFPILPLLRSACALT